MSVKHVGNVSTAEPRRDNASVAGHPIQLPPKYRDKTSGWIHICSFKQGVWDGEE